MKKRYFYTMKVKFSSPFYSPTEVEYIDEVLISGESQGGGKFSQLSASRLKEISNSHKVLLTTSGTDALEMAALLLDLKQGDEIIMPSFTFSSSANSLVLRGATPVFIDLDPKSMNMNLSHIESQINEKTKAILIVHYAGASTDMLELKSICKKYNLFLIEDAAQGYNSYFKNQHLGTFGDLGCISFHASKNLSCGEGGALLVNNSELIERSEIILEKGTNRKKFFSGLVDKYSWVDTGSSYLMSEISAAILYSQLLNTEHIQKNRDDVWQIYTNNLVHRYEEKDLRFQEYPANVKHNSHIFYLIMPNEDMAAHFKLQMHEIGINAISHYVPLHDSLAGKKYGITRYELEATNSLSPRLVRLPIWSRDGFPVDFVISKVTNVLDKILERY